MRKKSWLAFSIERGSKTPVFEQICSEIRRQAVSGELSQGATLPPTRTLAAELGVSRATIVTAYDQLVAEGYLEGRRGSGHILRPMGEVELGETKSPNRISSTAEKPVYPVPFHPGQPDMREFPHNAWARTVSRVARTRPHALLQGADPLGNMELRRAIALHVAEWRGIEATPEQIVITAGAGDGLELCLRTLCQPGQRIGLENPGYPPLRSFASALGLKPVSLCIDKQGAQLPERPGRIRLLVITPSHQFPLGGAMSPGRRLEFIRWAGQHDAWIIEDDYDSEFRYAGRPIPAMTGFNPNSRTIYVGSFSKIFSNSLRLGYVVFPQSLVAGATKTLLGFGIKASHMPQPVLAEFMLGGEFYRHLRRMRRLYSERRNYLLRRLKDDFARFGSAVDHHAGMQVGFHLIPEFRDADIAINARRQNLKIEALSEYCADDQNLNGLVLGYCAFNEDELERGLVGLRESFR